LVFFGFCRTQTNDTDFPSTVKIEEQINELKNDVTFQSTLLQHAHQSELTTHAQDLRCRLDQEILTLEKLSEARIHRVRHAARAELSSAIKALEAELHREYAQKAAEAQAKVDKAEEIAISKVREARLCATEASDQALVLKIQLAGVMAWIKQQYGEAECKVRFC
jgi:hypothetical protein